MSRKKFLSLAIFIMVFSVLVTWNIAMRYARSGYAVTAEDLILPTSQHFFSTGNEGDRYLSVNGYWEIEGDQNYYKKSDVKYSCFEPEGSCYIIDTAVKENFVMTTSYSRPIVKWDKEKLIIGPSSSSDTCRIETVIVDLISEEVTSITKNSPNWSSELCQLVPRLSSPRKSKLIDSWEKYKKEKFGDD